MSNSQPTQSSQLDSAAKTRMLTLAAAVAAWTTSTATSMYSTGFFDVRTALVVGPGISIIMFCAYIAVTKLAEVSNE